MIRLSAEQLAAVEAAETARAEHRSSFTIAGYAGTGKTTIIADLVDRIWATRTSCAVCTPTGKAAHVLRTKGVEAMTVHSLMYQPRQNGSKVSFVLRPDDLPDVVIVDEASMLDVRLVEDLRAHVPFLVFVGDHGQLEPVGDDPGIMKTPDVKLETIHRQAAGSPILQFAHRVRAGKAPFSLDTTGRVRMATRAPRDLPKYDVILCAYNNTRVSANAWMRRKLGYGAAKLPADGEKVICLRNNKELGVWNGMTGVVLEIDGRAKQISVETDDGPRLHMPFEPRQFGEAKTLQDRSLMRKGAPTLWDFGYAITCHKFQGSEADSVAVYDEASSSTLWDVNRWRYTAATRASERLLWITS